MNKYVIIGIGIAVVAVIAYLVANPAKLKAAATPATPAVGNGTTGGTTGSGTSSGTGTTSGAGTSGGVTGGSTPVDSTGVVGSGTASAPGGAVAARLAM